MVSGPAVHVIDDDNAARDALEFLLGAANFLVRGYGSVKTFLDAIPAAEPGCVIADLIMPEINGLDLLRLLKGREIAWPVIVVTGRADVPIAMEVMKLGAVDFIEKPYDAEVLLGAVRRALGRVPNDARNGPGIEIQRNLVHLSTQERRVLDALVDGRPNNSIAHELGLDVHVVEVHRASVMTKMQATNLSHLVRMMLAS